MKTAWLDRNRPRNRLLPCGIALLSLTLTQCDQFLTDYFWECPDGSRDCVTNQSMDSSSMDQSAPPDLKMPDPNTPLGPLRKFEWRASIPIDATKVKYVGMKGTMPVLWQNGTPQKWVVYQASPLPSSAIPGGVPKDFRRHPWASTLGRPIPWCLAARSLSCRLRTHRSRRGRGTWKF